MKTAIQLFGKGLPSFGKNLPLQISTTILSEPNNPALSFAINVQFVETMKIQEAKLVIHTRELMNENTIAFTGTFIKNEASTLCVGYCHTDYPLSECWITITTPATKTIQSKKSKIEFIKECKEYYEKKKIAFSEDGNRIKKFSFDEIISQIKVTNKMLNNKKSYPQKIHTEMYQNLFPISTTITEYMAVIVSFGEFIDENTIKRYTREEAQIMGIVE